MPFDPDILRTLMTSGAGAALGSFVKSMSTPEPDIKQRAVSFFISGIVGIVAGAATTEWFSLGVFMGFAASSACALASSEILKFIAVRSHSLSRGKLDITITKGEENGL
jgi:hypothetical protein